MCDYSLELLASRPAASTRRSHLREGAQLRRRCSPKSTSTFDADEHLRGRGPCPPRLGRIAANGDRTDTVLLRVISLACH